MEKTRLLELLKSEQDDIDAIEMILSNYTDYGHSDVGGMVSVKQFNKVAECLLEWWAGKSSHENIGLHLQNVMPSAFIANIEGKEYVVFERSPLTRALELELYEKADMIHGVLHNLKIVHEA